MSSKELDQAFVRIEQLAAGKSLPGLERSTSYRSPSLKVRKALFARLKDEQTLVLHCPSEQKALLMDISPEIYFETAHYVGHPAVLIRLDVIADEELALRLEDAWRFKAPKRLASERPTAAPDPK
ncbi:MmcQ/YjbR family DNA-binding protein [Devosia sp. 2618]|uniref:MmcQ/YjbR family DNA-binding protein n=1 Tax=Devosia sp. 2618 TaxID=3156454 RepID=UPI003391697B